MIYNLKKMYKEERRKNINYKQLKEENKTLKNELEFIEKFNNDVIANLIDIINTLNILYDKVINDYDFIKAQEKRLLLNRLKES